MKYRILVITKYRWRSRLKKHEAVSLLLKSGGINAHIETIHVDLGAPAVTNGRIDPSWYETNVTKRAIAGDFDHAVFQFSEKDGKLWGVDSGIRGHNIKDIDPIGESWICSDEHDILKYKTGPNRDKYTKVFAHEIGHELKNRGYTTLEIHDYDYKSERNRLEEFYKNLGLVKWSKYLPEPYFSNITQAFLEKNSLYTSGYHIGVDHGTKGKDNVPVYIPVDGKVTRVEVNHKTLGNCAYVLSKDEKWAFRLAHLRDAPIVGAYSAGDIIGVVGNTGLSTGIHLHVDAWKGGYVRPNLLTGKDAIVMNCVDPHKLIIEHI